jgi:hypothetical protein
VPQAAPEGSKYDNCGRGAVKPLAGRARDWPSWERAMHERRSCRRRNPARPRPPWRPGLGKWPHHKHNFGAV